MNFAVEFSTGGASSTPVGPATASTTGTVLLGRPIAGTYQAAQQLAQPTIGGTTDPAIAGRLYAVRWHRPLEVQEFDAILFRITIGAAGNAQVAVYTESTAGDPDALIWYSGNVSTAAAADKTTTFAAGTWVDTSYRSGVNLSIAANKRVWLALFFEAAPEFATNPQGTVDALGVLTGATTTEQVIFLYATAPPAYGVPPAVFGAVTEETAITADTPMIMLRTV